MMKKIYSPHADIVIPPRVNAIEKDTAADSHNDNLREIKEHGRMQWQFRFLSNAHYRNQTKHLDSHTLSTLFFENCYLFFDQSECVLF